MSCSSGSSCTAVSSDGNAFTWDGTFWAGPQRVPDAPALRSISCVAAYRCVAVDADSAYDLS